MRIVVLTGITLLVIGILSGIGIPRMTQVIENSHREKIEGEFHRNRDQIIQYVDSNVTALGNYLLNAMDGME